MFLFFLLNGLINTYLSNLKLVVFSSATCSPCKSLKKYLDTKEVEYQTVDVFEDMDYAMKYRISKTPTTMLIKENGDEFSRVLGFSTPKDKEDIALTISCFLFKNPLERKNRRKRKRITINEVPILPS